MITKFEDGREYIVHVKQSGTEYRFYDIRNELHRVYFTYEILKVGASSGSYSSVGATRKHHYNIRYVTEYLKSKRWIVLKHTEPSHLPEELFTL